MLAGLRWDRFEGDYVSPAHRPTVRRPTPRRAPIRCWSQRFGVLYQPTDTQSYYVSYGTSFNTSGELYNYDAPGSNTPPEKSRNIELGAKLDLFDGRLSTRAALFHSTKYNERNRDSPDGQPLGRLRALGQAPCDRPRARSRRPHHAGLGGLRLVRLDPERARSTRRRSASPRAASAKATGRR